MKKLALFLSVLAASSAMSETLDIKMLSPYEQELHRYGWCQAAYLAEGMNDQPDLEDYQHGGAPGGEARPGNRASHTAKVQKLIHWVVWLHKSHPLS